MCFHDGTTPIATHTGPVFTIHCEWSSGEVAVRERDWYVCPREGIRPYLSYKGEGDVPLYVWDEASKTFDWLLYEPPIKDGRMICLGVWPTREAAQTYLDTYQPRP